MPSGGLGATSSRSLRRPRRSKLAGRKGGRRIGPKPFFLLIRVCLRGRGRDRTRSRKAGTVQLADPDEARHRRRTLLRWRAPPDRGRLHRLRLAGRPPRLHKGRITLIGCPKLDERKSFVETLAAILAAHEIEDITVLEMEVPCCSNLEAFMRQALKMEGEGFAREKRHPRDRRGVQG